MSILSAWATATPMLAEQLPPYAPLPASSVYPAHAPVPTKPQRRQPYSDTTYTSLGALFPCQSMREECSRRSLFHICFLSFVFPIKAPHTLLHTLHTSTATMLKIPATSAIGRVRRR